MDHRQGPQKPRGFLDLPLEVRIEIYNVILCSPPPPALWPLEQQDLVGLPEKELYIKHPYDTQILRVNRQIHAEAWDAMIRGNQFIRIQGRHASGQPPAQGVGICSFVEKVMRWRQIPILTTTAQLRASFKGFVMTHVLVWLGDDPGPPAFPHEMEHGHDDKTGDLDFVILRRDLDVFCETLAFVGTVARNQFDTATGHFITVHNPFDDTLSPDFMGATNQERLLRPYSDHFRGFTTVKIDGHVSPEVKNLLHKRLAEEQFASPSEALEGVQAAKDLGNSFFRQREFYKAAAAYWIAHSKAQHIKKRNTWTKTKAEGGASFVHAVAEAYYQVCLNAAQNLLTWIRESSCAQPYIRAFRASFYVDQAAASPALFETEWRPSLAQMAKANFRMASAQRVMGDLQSAKMYIDRARLQSPGDQIIRREAEDIEAEMRARAGLGRLLR